MASASEQAVKVKTRLKVRSPETGATSVSLPKPISVKTSVVDTVKFKVVCRPVGG